MKDRVFIDSNIWLYGLIKSGDFKKNKISCKLLQELETIIVSSQVINEVSVNLLKKARVEEDFLQNFIKDMFSSYEVVNINKNTLITASDLRIKYSLSYWDSIIVSSAMNSGCSKLYSEDMQNKQIFNDTLEIINPYL